MLFSLVKITVQGLHYYGKWRKKMIKICNNLEEISYITEDTENWK